MSQPVVVRPANERDSAPILAIYNWAIAHTTATMDTEPRSGTTHSEWMAKHDGNPYPLFVATHPEDGTVLGYACLSAYNPKPGYRTTAEVSIYIHPDWQGLGIGNVLLTTLIREADTRGFVALVSLITADNTASLKLHTKHGFATMGVLRSVGFKLGQWIDVALLERTRTPNLLPPSQTSQIG
jgi:phosphinothricin acetyltransferase